jgi:NAD(P)-dependent dehydrogenase (short-subunit alcohol dehydrogenase family)
MTKAFTLDVVPCNIRSNTIAPTYIETKQIQPFLEDTAFRAAVLQEIRWAAWQG